MIYRFINTNILISSFNTKQKQPAIAPTVPFFPQAINLFFYLPQNLRRVQVCLLCCSSFFCVLKG